MDTFNCEFSTPLTFENLPPALATDFWQYQKMACDLPAQATITDGTNTFYISKSVDFGELVLVFFLTLFLMIKIFTLVWDFVFPKIVKIFSKTQDL